MILAWASPFNIFNSIFKDYFFYFLTSFNPLSVFLYYTSNMVETKCNAIMLNNYFNDNKAFKKHTVDHGFNMVTSEYSHLEIIL